MFNHEPASYHCPFCFVLAGGENELNSQRDIVRRGSEATALVAPRWWPKNPGHVLVISNQHHENLYDLPPKAAHAVSDLIQAVAVAMRDSYHCDGISTRQHNEPAGGQDVWHYHVHVFPRYADDELYASPPAPAFMPADRRWKYADKLRNRLDYHDMGSAWNP